MKKIIIFTIATIFCITSLSYAQYGDYYDGKNSYSYSDMPSPKNKSSSISRKSLISISPSFYIPTGDKAYIKDFTGIGGGFDINYSYSFHKFFGIQGGFRYNYAGGTNINPERELETGHHLMDLRLMAVLQYDSINETKGFIPYVAAGVVFSTAVINRYEEGTSYKYDSDGTLYKTSKYKINEQKVGSNVGFGVAAGLRYVFNNNAVIGAGVDYTHVFPLHDYAGVRVFLEAGYRF